MHLKPMQKRIIAQLRHGPASVLELSAASGLSDRAVHIEVSHLRRAGILAPSGQRTRNPSGRFAIRWALVHDPGPEAAP